MLSLFKVFLNELLPDSALNFNLSCFSEISSDDNLIERRRDYIVNTLFFLSKDVAKLVIKYDYELAGKSCTYIGHRKSVRWLTNLPNFRIASGADYSTTIKIWNIKTGKLDMCFPKHDYSLRCLASLSDGRVIAGYSDNKIKIWNPETGKCDGILMGHNDFLTGIAELPGGRIVSSSWDRSIKIWNPKNYRCEITFVGHLALIRCLIVLHDARIATCSSDGYIKIWNTETRNCDVSIFASHKIIYCIAELLDSRILSVMSKSEFEIWNPNTGQCENNFKINLGFDIKCISVLPDSRIICGINKNLKILDLNELTFDSRIISQSDTISCILTLPDGRIVSGSYDGTLKIWS